MLNAKRHYPRAYVLAQLASEEFAKVQLLLSLLVARISGLNPPMESFWTWWVSHEDKSSFQESWSEALTWPSVQKWLDLPPDAVVKDLVPEWMEKFGGFAGRSQTPCPVRVKLAGGCNLH